MISIKTKNCQNTQDSSIELQKCMFLSNQILFLVVHWFVSRSHGSPIEKKHFFLIIFSHCTRLFCDSEDNSRALMTEHVLDSIQLCSLLAIQTWVVPLIATSKSPRLFICPDVNPRLSLETDSCPSLFF